MIVNGYLAVVNDFQMNRAEMVYEPSNNVWYSIVLFCGAPGNVNDDSIQCVAVDVTRGSARTRRDMEVFSSLTKHATVVINLTSGLLWYRFLLITSYVINESDKLIQPIATSDSERKLRCKLSLPEFQRQNHMSSKISLRETYIL